MKIVKKLMTGALIALSALAFVACSMEAESNDGSKAATRLEQGYKEPPKQGTGGNIDNPDGGATSQKFWAGYAPFVGIQVWGPSEGWGQAPLIDLDAGTITAEAASPAVMFPVFGGYDETGAAVIGSYDCSKIKKIEFDVKASKAGGTMTFASYISGGEVKHADGVALSTEFERKSYTISSGSDDVEILFYFNLSIPSKGYTVTVNNIAFYDADGKQVTDIPFNVY